MSDIQMVILVLVMAVITYLLRMIPTVFFRKKIKSRFINSVLFYVPYAVLSAMTFPFIFFVTENVIASIVGTVFALATALFKRPLLEVAMVACVTTLIAQYIIILI